MHNLAEWNQRWPHEVDGNAAGMPRAEQPQAQEPMPSPTVVMVPDSSDFITDCISTHRHPIRSVVALPRPGHTLKRSPLIEFGHPQASVEYSDLPFDSLGKHSEYGADISAGQEFKGAERLG